MQSHSYKSFGTPKTPLGAPRIPEDITQWPKFENIAELASWWFGPANKSSKVSEKLDIRTALVKTRWYARRNGCADEEKHWQAWWNMLSAHNCMFQHGGAGNPQKPINRDMWRGWVGFSNKTPPAVKAAVAQKALDSFIFTGAKKLRHSWRWALPYAKAHKDKQFDKLSLDAATMWTALIALHKAKDGDYSLLKSLWQLHEQRMGIPIAVLALVYLPKTEELRDLVTDFTYFREEPMFNGGSVLGFELVHRMASLGWLPENPPKIWSAWCKTYLNTETDTDGITRAFASETIPWSWKREALVQNIESMLVSQVFDFSCNAFTKVKPDSALPLVERNFIVNALLEKFKARWDRVIESDREELKTRILAWCEEWLPEKKSTLATWAALDLDFEQAQQSLVSSQVSSLPLPDDIDNGLR